MKGGPAWTTLALVLLLLVNPALGDDESSFRSFVNGIGEMIFAVAWPTAEYERVSFGGIRDISGGTEIRFRLHGTSGFSGGHLWTDVVIDFKNGGITDLRFGTHNAFVPPGTTASALGALVTELAEEWSENSSTPSSGTRTNNLTSSPGNGGSYRAKVESQIAAERRRLLSDGFQESHNAVFGTLGDDTSGTITLRLRRGFTYRFSGYCDQDCSDVDLHLFGSSGSALVSDIASDDYPKLTFSPRAEGTYTIKVSMITCRASPCHYGVAVFVR